MHSDDSTVLKGVLWATRGPWFTLRQVRAGRADGSETLMDGEVVIHRENVAFFQVVP